MKREYSAGIVAYREQIINNKPVRLYLLLYYPKGYWDFAKGHLEPGESSRDAADRELHEETGLHAQVDEGFKQSFEYYFTAEGELVLKKVTFFVGKALSEEVLLSHEHEAYAWLPFDQAVERLTYTNAQQLLQAAESYLIEHNG